MVTRRTLLKGLGTAAAAGAVATGTASANGTVSAHARGRLDLVGHSLLSDPPGGYTEVDVRADGAYAVLGSFYGTGGSFLADLSDPANPTQVHGLESAETTRNADVKFGAREGIYYRSQEPNEDGAAGGVEVVDYGYDQGSIEEPVVAGRVDRPSGVHNLQPHPEEPVLYVVNGTDPDGNRVGLTVYDTSDPTSPEQVAAVVEAGGNHDVTYDPAREMVHSAFISGDATGWIGHDVSDPMDPVEVGRFSYADRPGYSEIGTAGFDSCHYARADPERDLLYVGDEIAQGMPGGKHVLDIGYGDGSLSDPQHLSFTHGPNAKPMEYDDELYDFTTHNHDVVHTGEATLLVDGSYHEGVVVFDVTDPEAITPGHQYLTVDGAEEAQGATWLGAAPMSWNAVYDEATDLVVASDVNTGLYTFDVSDERQPVYSVREAVDTNGDGELQKPEFQRAMSYWIRDETVPNTGPAGNNEKITARMAGELMAWYRQS
jgi:hypothetical protein